MSPIVLELIKESLDEKMNYKDTLSIITQILFALGRIENNILTSFVATMPSITLNSALELQEHFAVAFKEDFKNMFTEKIM